MLTAEKTVAKVINLTFISNKNLKINVTNEININHDNRISSYRRIY